MAQFYKETNKLIKLSLLEESIDRLKLIEKIDIKILKKTTSREFSVLLKLSLIFLELGELLGKKNSL